MSTTKLKIRRCGQTLLFLYLNAFSSRIMDYPQTVPRRDWKWNPGLSSTVSMNLFSWVGLSHLNGANNGGWNQRSLLGFYLWQYPELFLLFFVLFCFCFITFHLAFYWSVLPTKLNDFLQYFFLGG